MPEEMTEARAVALTLVGSVVFVLVAVWEPLALMTGVCLVAAVLLATWGWSKRDDAERPPSPDAGHAEFRQQVTASGLDTDTEQAVLAVDLLQRVGAPAPRSVRDSTRLGVAALALLLLGGVFALADKALETATIAPDVPEEPSGSEPPAE